MASNHKLIKTAKGYLIITSTTPTTEAATALIEQLKSQTGEDWAILVGTDLVSIELDFATEWAEMSKMIDGIPHRIKGLTQESGPTVGESVWRISVEVNSRNYTTVGPTHAEAVGKMVASLKQAGLA